MKKITIIILLIIFNVKAVIGQYKPILVDGNKWNYSFEGFYPSTEIYTCIGDTIINNITYKALQGALSQNSQYWREDTSQKKVYMFINDSTEYLMYDFDILLGDTITLDSTYAEKYTDDFLILDSIKSKLDIFHTAHMINCGILDTNFGGNVYFFSKWRNDSSQSGSTVWVEGIGSLSWFYDPYDAYDGLAFMNCFTDSTGYQYYTKCNIGDSCPPPLADIKNSNLNQFYKIMPNPFVSKFTIMGTDINVTPKVYDITGKKYHVSYEKNGKSIIIDGSQLKPGVYITLLYNRKELVSVLQVMKSK